MKREKISEIVAEIQALQRSRRWYLKMRDMNANPIRSLVAGKLGFTTDMTDEEREKKFSEAQKLINKIVKGKIQVPEMQEFVMAANMAISNFNAKKEMYDEEMVVAVKKLPMADAFCDHPDRRGFAHLFLAEFLGETGDLFNYSTVAKVWKRMGSAPFEKNGEIHMGSAWMKQKKLKGKLSDDDWKDLGYCPRRRSILYLMGKNMRNQNWRVPPVKEKITKKILVPGVAGPYRAKYEKKKAEWQARFPEELGKGPGKGPGHSDLQGMLVASKLLAKDITLAYWAQDPSFVPESKPWKG